MEVEVEVQVANLVKSGEKARKKKRFDECADHLTQALELLEDGAPRHRARALQRLAQCYFEAGRHTEAVLAAQQAIDLEIDRNQPEQEFLLELHRLQSRTASALYRHLEAECWCRDGLVLLERADDDPKRKAELLELHAICLKRIGRFRDAMEQMDRAREVWSQQDKGRAEALLGERSLLAEHLATIKRAKGDALLVGLCKEPIDDKRSRLHLYHGEGEITVLVSSSEKKPHVLQLVDRPRSEHFLEGLANWLSLSVPEATGGTTRASRCSCIQQGTRTHKESVITSYQLELEASPDCATELALDAWHDDDFGLLSLRADKELVLDAFRVVLRDGPWERKSQVGATEVIGAAIVEKTEPLRIEDATSVRHTTWMGSTLCIARGEQLFTFEDPGQEPKQLFRAPGDIQSVSAGKAQVAFIAYGLTKQVAYLYDPEQDTLTALFELEPSDQEPSWSFCWHPDKPLLALSVKAAGEENTRVFDLEDGSRVAATKGGARFWTDRTLILHRARSEGGIDLFRWDPEDDASELYELNGYPSPDGRFHVLRRGGRVVITDNKGNTEKLTGFQAPLPVGIMPPYPHAGPDRWWLGPHHLSVDVESPAVLDLEQHSLQYLFADQTLRHVTTRPDGKLIIGETIYGELVFGKASEA